MPPRFSASGLLARLRAEKGPVEKSNIEAPANDGSKESESNQHNDSAAQLVQGRPALLNQAPDNASTSAPVSKAPSPTNRLAQLTRRASQRLQLRQRRQKRQQLRDATRDQSSSQETLLELAKDLIPFDNYAHVVEAGVEMLRLTLGMQLGDSEFDAAQASDIAREKELEEKWTPEEYQILAALLQQNTAEGIADAVRRHPQLGSAHIANDDIQNAVLQLRQLQQQQRQQQQQQLQQHQLQVDAIASQLFNALRPVFVNNVLEGQRRVADLTKQLSRDKEVTTLRFQTAIQRLQASGLLKLAQSFSNFSLEQKRLITQQHPQLAPLMTHLKEANAQRIISERRIMAFQKVVMILRNQGLMEDPSANAEATANFSDVMQRAIKSANRKNTDETEDGEGDSDASESDDEEGYWSAHSDDDTSRRSRRSKKKRVTTKKRDMGDEDQPSEPVRRSRRARQHVDYTQTNAMDEWIKQMDHEAKKDAPTERIDALLEERAALLPVASDDENEENDGEDDGVDDGADDTNDVGDHNGADDGVTEDNDGVTEDDVVEHCLDVCERLHVAEWSRQHPQQPTWQAPSLSRASLVTVCDATHCTDTDNRLARAQLRRRRRWKRRAWQKQTQYLVKLVGKSYLHLEWLTVEQMVRRFGKVSVQRRVSKFRRDLPVLRRKYKTLYGGLPFDPVLLEIERVIAQDDDKYLVKWKATSYADCTWETLSDIAKLDGQDFVEELRQRDAPVEQEDLLPKLPEQAEAESRIGEWYKDARTYGNGLTLRDYQRKGLNWLISLYWRKRNGILADEMGLGKTVQSAVYLEHLVRQWNVVGPHLVVAPLSTLPHWERTLRKWTDLNVIVYHGNSPAREVIRAHEFFRESGGVKFNVLITSYELILADFSELVSLEWQQLIVDEGHRLKARNSQLSEALTKFNAQRHLLLTGTPIQNGINELFQLLKFLQPKKFKDLDEFVAEFSDLTSVAQVDELRKRIEPFMLRRVKADVERGSLPPKFETIVDVELTTTQKQYYRAVYERNREFLSRGGLEKKPSLRNVDMQLRKVCNHPFLVEGAIEHATSAHALERRKQESKVPEAVTAESLYFDALVNGSGKMILLDKLLTKLKQEGHRVLIFSGMKNMLNLLEDYLLWKELPFERIDGNTTAIERQQAIDRFSAENSDRFVFLLTTRAGGVGINLTAADTVIMFDPDWNPQADLQACARCHRIGQQRNVHVYRLVTAKTYETQMFARASKKLGLDKAIMHRIQDDGDAETDSAEVASSKLDAKREELDRMLRFGAYHVVPKDEENQKKDEQAERTFCEADIDELLRTHARTVKIDSVEEDNSLIEFNKIAFAAAEADSSLDWAADNFWDQVLPKQAGLDEATELLQKTQQLQERVAQRASLRSKAAKEAVHDDMESLCAQYVCALDSADIRRYLEIAPVLDCLEQMSSLRSLPAATRAAAGEWKQRLMQAHDGAQQDADLAEQPAAQKTSRKRRARRRGGDDDYEPDADDEFLPASHADSAADQDALSDASSDDDRPLRGRRKRRRTRRSLQ